MGRKDRHWRWLEKGIEAMRQNKLLEERLAALKNWGGRVVEFLDEFEGMDDGENECALEAKALQEEGLKLGLVRIYPPKKKECSGCGHWSQEGEQDGYCECVGSPFCDVITNSDTNCEHWKEY